MANRVKAAFQFLSGIVHFLPMLFSASYTALTRTTLHGL
jgi:hypothetical protein